MTFNRFGAVAADLPPLYTGTIAADFGGDTAILASIDRAVDLIAGALSPRTYDAILHPSLVRLVARATAGQTVLPAVPLLPVKTGSVHVWVGYPTEFVDKPRRLYDPKGAGLLDLPAAGFSVVDATGVITLATPMAADQQAFATYDTEPESSSFSMPSLARLAVRGAAAEMGARLYTQGTQEWALVDEYRTTCIDELARLRTGDSIPDEIRLAVFWSEIERTSQTVGSVDLLRG